MPYPTQQDAGVLRLLEGPARRRRGGQHQADQCMFLRPRQELPDPQLVGRVLPYPGPVPQVAEDCGKAGRQIERGDVGVR